MRGKPDHFAMKAKREGYPARSVYKLEEIHQKHRVFRPNSTVLDIGAAPGSWSLYVLKALSAGGFLVSIDLSPIKIRPPDKNGAPGFEPIRGDAFSPEIRERIARLGPFDAILSDAAPATTGNKLVDAARSATLVESVIGTAEQDLKPGGNLVVKIFQGGYEQELLTTMRGIFQTVKPVKPAASRNESFELFYVGLGKVGLGKVGLRNV